MYRETGVQKYRFKERQEAEIKTYRETEDRNKDTYIERQKNK